MEAYEPRLKGFLSALEAEEENIRDNSRIAGSMESLSLSDWNMPLSQRMRESWESKTWMINYAARNSWAFDFIFWKFLDTRYFGPNDDGDYHARLDLLTQQEIQAMQPFV